MKMNKIILLILFFLISMSILFAEGPVYVNHGERYFKFQINDRSELNTLTRMISIDNVKGNTVFAYANQKEWDTFNLLDYKPILLPAPSTLIKPKMMQNERDYTTFDAYPTYDQYVSMMTAFATNYPNLCQLYTLGTLASGRKLLFAHISSNVATPAAKPEVMYTSSIHGDELTGAICMLHLISELLTKYGTDTRLTNMVDNLDIWINPLANPDGTYAGGNNTVSGATRGNHNGTDMNRNFRDPVIGYPSTQELEVTLFQTFADTHHFVQVANFHGGAEVFNYPWDDWVSSTHTHADASWFITEGQAWISAARTNSSNYMTDVVSSGVTEGGDWYVINGGRQDYTNYFSHGREVTIELSSTKTLAASLLLTYWGYNYESMLKYLERPYYAIRGTVTNTSGAGIAATVTVNSHDAMNTEVIADPTFGDYYRMIAPGTWSLTFSAEGYASQTFNNVVVTASTPTFLNVVLERVMTAPTNIQAFPGNNSVLLTWTAPVPAPGGGYKIYKNGSLLTTASSAATSYTDNAVTNGNTYSYYLVSVYTGPPGESAASSTVNATPLAAAPISLSATAGNATVSLTWSVPMAGTPSGYKVYRNSVLLTPTPIVVLNYTDNAVANGVSYSYYVTATYTSPAAESGPSNTVNATPNATTFVTIGTGTTLTSRYPLSSYYGYERQASLFTSTEIGITGNIQTLSWWPTVTASASIPVKIYIKTQTGTTLASATWATMISGSTTVFDGTVNGITAGAWKTIDITDYTYTANNLIIMVECNYGSTGSGTSTGAAFRYTASASNMVESWATDTNPPTTTGTRSTNRPNIQLAIVPPVPNPAYANNQTSLDFGTVTTGQTAVRSFTLTNTGGGLLSGNITTPTGYTVAVASKAEKTESRSTLAYNVAAGTPVIYNVTFTPLLGQAYNGSITITSNDPLHTSNTLAVSGAGITPAAIGLNPLTLTTSLNAGASGNDQITISNSGGTTLDYSISISYSARGILTGSSRDIERTMSWLSANPLSGSIVGNNSTQIAIGFNTVGLTPGTYDGTIAISSNDPQNPTKQINVTLSVNPLMPPSALEVHSEPGNMSITWASVPYASTYYVYRASELNGTYTQIATVHTNSYFDTDISGRVYFYYVTAE
jgi:fibronectin type 3 domain-containing protein